MKILFSDEDLKKSGVYIITSPYDSRVYIGSAKSFQKRRNVHIFLLRNKRHHSKEMQILFDKYAFKAFEMDVLEKCEIDILRDREQLYINQYESYMPEKGFNTHPNAFTSKGVIRRPEYKLRISESLKQYFSDPQNKAKYAESMRKINRKKMALECQNRPEVKEKTRQAKLGDKNPASKLSSIVVSEIKKLIILGYPQKDIADIYNISRSVVCQINKGILWKEITAAPIMSDDKYYNKQRISNRSSLDANQVKEVKEMLAVGIDRKTIAKNTGIAQHIVKSIDLGYVYQWV